MELLRDRGDEVRAAGLRPFGISRDSPWTHVAWTQALDLNFPKISGPMRLGGERKRGLQRFEIGGGVWLPAARTRIAPPCAAATSVLSRPTAVAARLSAVTNSGDTTLLTV